VTTAATLQESNDTNIELRDSRNQVYEETPDEFVGIR
jgi:hypothetical protein